MLESPHWGDSEGDSNNIQNMFYRNKTESFFDIILLIKKSWKKQIHFNDNIFWNTCCRRDEGSPYYNGLVAQVTTN